MIKNLTVLTLVTLISSTAFAHSIDEAKKAAVMAFKNSPLIKQAAIDKCGGNLMDQNEPTASLLHQDDVMGQYYPILVVQEIGCTFSGESIAAIVRTATRLDMSTGKLTYEVKEPVILDLTSLIQ